MFLTADSQHQTMSADEDKYPAESGRRRFVKGVVGGAALAGVGATGAVSMNTLTTSSGAGGGPVEAMVIENTAGPAPRGMPQIPIEIDDDGFIKGVWPEIQTETVEGVEVEVAREDIGGVTYSQEWFQYCGLESNNALDPSYESDNYLIADPSTKYEWQSDMSEGQQINISDFEDYKTWGNDIGSTGIGKAGSAIWRSGDSENPMPVTILRSEAIEQAAQDNEWLSASTDQGVIAWLNKCTHFCCVPGYKTASGSAKYNAADKVYCACHQSVYDPLSIVTALYISRPRPTG
jgi:Rieske Fe-S protein